MIHESPELAAVTRRWLKAFSDADARAMANLYMKSGMVCYIGTDPAEWWKGHELEAALPVHMTQIRDELRVTFETNEVEAFEYGNIGWSSVSAQASFPSMGDAVPFRFTFVFVLEDGVWRVVQNHNSIAVANPDAVGVKLTKGLEALLGEMGDKAETDIRASFSEGMVTVMFTDIEDSTSWNARLGDAGWASVISWHDSMVRRIIESHSGSVVKTLGDGAMVVFESTRAAAHAANDIQGALAAAKDQPEIRVRIGLHVGEVLRSGEDYLGQAVSKAARIASAAAGAEIMVSSAVAALLSDGTEFEFGAPVNTELKGIPGIHTVTPLLLRQ